jgi:phospholipid N-methyltransferase
MGLYPAAREGDNPASMLSFVRQAMKDFQHTGAIWPSGPGLAAVMTRTLGSVQGPRRLLEVGPGTGAFTKAVLKQLLPDDEFVIVELSEAFCAELDARLLREFRAANPLIKIELHCAPIESAPIEGPFDFIVCGLPFNNFPPALVRRILRHLLSLLRSDGELAYFEYAGVRAMKSPLVNSKSRQGLRRIASYSKALRQRLGGRTELVLGNFPPCLAVRLPAPAPGSGHSRGRSRRLTQAELRSQRRADREVKRQERSAPRSAAPSTGGSSSKDGSGAQKASSKVLGLASKLKLTRTASKAAEEPASELAGKGGSSRAGAANRGAGRSRPGSHTR